MKIEKKTLPGETKVTMKYPWKVSLKPEVPFLRPKGALRKQKMALPVPAQKI